MFVQEVINMRPPVVLLLITLTSVNNLIGILAVVNFKNLGCFTMKSLRESNDVVGLPTDVLEPCLTPCSYNLTSYFAVQKIVEDNSSSLKYFCLCGNSPDTYLQGVNRSECQTCSNDSDCDSLLCDSLCGGYETVSLYLPYDGDSTKIVNSYSYSTIETTSKKTDFELARTTIKENSYISKLFNVTQKEKINNPKIQVDNYLSSLSTENQLSKNNYVTTADRENSENSFLTIIKEDENADNKFIITTLRKKANKNYLSTVKNHHSYWSDLGFWASSNHENSNKNKGNRLVTKNNENTISFLTTTTEQEEADNNYKTTTEQENRNYFPFTEEAAPDKGMYSSSTHSTHKDLTVLHSLFLKETNNNYLSATNNQQNDTDDDDTMWPFWFVPSHFEESQDNADGQSNSITNYEEANNTAMSEDNRNVFIKVKDTAQDMDGHVTVSNKTTDKNNLRHKKIIEEDINVKFATVSSQDDIIINKTEEFENNLINSTIKGKSAGIYSENKTEEEVICVHTTTPSLQGNENHTITVLVENDSDSNSTPEPLVIYVSGALSACMAFGGLIACLKFRGDYSLASLIPS